MAFNENDKKYLYEGYFQAAGRRGNLYVLKKGNCWHLNAGVNSWGHDPGFGVFYDVSCDSEEFNAFEQFLEKTDRIQQFIKSELGAEDDVCNEIFKKIWDYIHHTSCN